jgi:hypothetical protein
MPKQAAILEQQEISESINSAAGAYKLSYMLPAELGKLENEVVILTSQNAEILASTIRQDNLATEQVIKLREEVDLLESQDLEVQASTIRQDDAVTEQIAASQANTTMKQGLSTAQENLYIRQEAGFDEDYKYKIFTQLLGLRSTGLTQEVPGLNSGTGASSGNALVNALLTDAGIPVSNVLSDTISA